MIVLFAVLLIGVPYILGTAFTMILGERSLRGPLRWVVGVLSVFVCFFVSLLIQLKLHGTLNDLSRTFGIILTAFTGGSVPVVLFAFAKKSVRFQNFDKKILIWLIPAVILGAFSVFVLDASYVNDATVETVRTTLYTGKIYEYSSLLGIRMEAGLPIFVKIEIVPMLYACLCNMFHIDVLVITGILAPMATYTAHIFIMYEISAFAVKEKHRSLFMIFHLLILLAGTYLPENAVPVTVGRPLLMQGYSGFAWGYGVLVPMIVLVCLQKRFFLAAFIAIPFVGLIKTDRFFFAAIEGYKSYLLLNYAGKLLLLYVVSLILQLLKRKTERKLPIPLYFSGSALISASMVDAYEYVGEKKIFAVSMGLLIMACCSFMPFKGGTVSSDEHSLDTAAIKGNAGEVTVWAPEDVIDEVRMEDASIKPIYGRDMYNDMLAGVNFEPYSDDARELCDIMAVVDTYTDDYVESIYCPVLEVNKELDRVDVVLLPLDTLSVKIEKTLADRGFDDVNEHDGFLIMRKSAHD